MQPNDWIALAALAVTFLGTLFGFIWGSSWWLSKQFVAIKSLIYSQTEQVKAAILAKLEYHERHDDQRFKSVTDEIWAIKIRNAARDGIHFEVTEKKENK